MSNDCPVEIQISTDKSNYILGEKIPIHLGFKNRDEQNVTTSYNLTIMQYAEDAIDISILDYQQNILNISGNADIPSNGSLNVTHEMQFSDYKTNGHYVVKARINEACVESAEFDINSGLEVTLMSPENITINSPLDVCLRIKNILDYPVNNITVLPHISSQLDIIGPSTIEISELAPGEAVNETWSINMSTAGGHTIGFDAFSNDTGFNKVYSVINVLALPEIYIECEDIPLLKDYKTPFKAVFKVNNIGDLVATNVSARIVLPEGATSSETMWTIGNLNGGENVTLQANISLSKPEDSFIYVLASDSAGHNASNIIYINLLSNISASIEGLNSNTGLNVNGDDKYDYLVAEIGVNVTESGLGKVEAWLYDGDGNNITKAENSSYFFTENRSISLKFSGIDIFKHGWNGPYLIRDLKLFNDSGGLIDNASPAYSTSAYNFTDFCPLIRLGGTYSDRGNDLDNDGLFEGLTTGIEVIPILDGYCYAIANLVDGNGTQITATQNTTWLSANQPSIMQLNFDGKDIHENKMNGPYYLRDLYVYHTADLNHPDLAIDAYSTEAYSYLDFEGYSCSISGTKFNDTNSNATRDPGEAGLPGWTIRLTRPDGTSINATTDASGAYKFENLTSGTYRVSEVRQSNWTQTYPEWLGDHIINVTDGNVTGVDFGNNYLPVPDIPFPPSGPASGIPGAEYSYTTSSTDPSGYQIAYTFDWGDGTNSTTGLFDSGAIASAAHIWNSSGVNQVQAMATNSKGASSGWSDPLNVTVNAPPSIPTVTNGIGCSLVTANSARLNDEIIDTGGENPTVHICWGTADGATTQASWQNDAPLGVQGTGAFNKDISGLTPGTQYYYRCYATNSAGTGWAGSTANFTTQAILSQPVYRMYSPSQTDHFYTTNYYEYSTIAPAVGYIGEGTLGNIFGSSQNGTVPVYRMYSPSQTDHFYTTNYYEYSTIAPAVGYIGEGTLGNIFGSSQTGTVPVYRMYSPSQTDHFYTTNYYEYSAIAPAVGYIGEGILGYIQPVGLAKEDDLPQVLVNASSNETR